MLRVPKSFGPDGKQSSVLPPPPPVPQTGTSRCFADRGERRVSQERDLVLSENAPVPSPLLPASRLHLPAPFSGAPHGAAAQASLSDPAIAAGSTATPDVGLRNGRGFCGNCDVFQLRCKIDSLVFSVYRDRERSGRSRPGSGGVSLRSLPVRKVRSPASSNSCRTSG